MTVTTDPIALLSRSLDQMRAVVAAIGADQAELSTPCLSWDVRTLVEHVIHDLDKFAVRAQGGQPDWSAPAPYVDDWLPAFDTGAAKLLRAWRETAGTGAAVQPNHLPAINQQATEMAVHAWDLVRATGQDMQLDPFVAEAALEWARTAMRREFRGDESEGKGFGHEVPVPDDAPAYDRLVGFFGRQPQWASR